MRRVLWVAILAGCYSPAPPAGSPCVSNDQCPRPLVCDPGTLSCQDTACTASQTCPDVAPPSDGSVDGDSMPVDVAPADCWDHWTSGTGPAFTDRRRVGVSTPSMEGDPSLSPDNLELYFIRRANNFEIYVSRRASLADDFTAAERVSNLMTQNEDTRASLSPDGLELFFASKRNNAVGGSDIWTARRSSPSASFDMVTLANTGGLNTNRDQYDPELSADSRTLYYANVPEGMSQQIAFATRPGGGAPFSIPEALDLAVPNAVAYADPSVSPDQLVIVYSATAGGSGADLYYAVRSSMNDDFGVRGKVPGVNTDDAVERDAEVSADGCHLYFAGGIAGTQTPDDIYVADVVR